MILLVIINLIAGILGQQIILENSTYVTQCSTGLVNGTDEFVLHATFGPNITYLTSLSGGWALSASLQILKEKSTQFEDICNIMFGVSGSFCTPSTQRCYCDHVDASGTAHVVVKGLALLSYSQGIVRFEWPHTNGTSLHSDKNITLRSIHDPKNAKVELKVNNKTTTNGTNGSCSASLLAETDNTIQLCCTDTGIPCYSTLTFNGTNNTYNECVTITGIKPNINFTSSVHSYYSVCSPNQFILKDSCTIITRKQTDNDHSNSDDDNTMLIIVTKMLFIPAVLGSIVIVFLCCKKCIKKGERKCHRNCDRCIIVCPSLLNNRMAVSSSALTQALA